MSEREKRRKEALDKAYYEIFEKGRERKPSAPPPPHPNDPSLQQPDN